MDYNKIYIYITGKYTGKNFVFKTLETPIQFNNIQTSIGRIDLGNVTKLIELTEFGSVNTILQDPIFKQAIKEDWLRAYNEFGIEIDDYTSKVFDDLNSYSDGEVPTWDDNDNRFEPSTPAGGSNTKHTQLICINPVIANTPFFINASSFNFTFEGDIPDLRNSVINFNTDIKLQIELNSIKQSKGSQVQRFSATQLQFNESIEIGETIFIYS